MRQLLVSAVMIAAMLVFVAGAPAKGAKLTFDDVTYPDGTTGEIEAGAKNTNKTHLTNCSYFSDDYREWLGYYAEQSETTASTDPDAVRAFCLEHFDERIQ